MDDETMKKVIKVFVIMSVGASIVILGAMVIGSILK